MTLEILYLLAGIVSALGVIGSVLFLAVQLRQQNREARIVLEREIRRDLREALRDYMSDLETTGLIRTCLEQGIAAVSEEEAFRFIALHGNFYHFWEGVFTNWKRAEIEDELYFGLERIVINTITAQGSRDYWALLGPTFQSAFRARVERMRDLQEAVEADGSILSFVSHTPDPEPNAERRKKSFRKRRT
ncbi:MAG: hypothetical protein WBA35_00795 [Litorimonas sp.]